MPDVILIRNQYPDAAALRRVLDYVCRSGMIGGYAVDPVYAFRDFLQERFPRSNVHIYQSFPDSDVNRFGCSDDDELLRID